MAEPKCPACSIEGIEHFASRRSVEQSRRRDPWFVVVYCNGCGHVHQVLAKHVFAETGAPRLVIPPRPS